MQNWLPVNTELISPTRNQFQGKISAVTPEEDYNRRNPEFSLEGDSHCGDEEKQGGYQVNLE